MVENKSVSLRTLTKLQLSYFLHVTKISGHSNTMYLSYVHITCCTLMDLFQPPFKCVRCVKLWTILDLDRGLYSNVLIKWKCPYFNIWFYFSRFSDVRGMTNIFANFFLLWIYNSRYVCVWDCSLMLVYQYWSWHF